MSAWRKISTKVPSDVISCAPGQPVGRNKGETVCKYSIDAPPLAPESVLDLSELLQQGRNSIRARLCGCDDDGGKSPSFPLASRVEMIDVLRDTGPQG